MSGRHAAADPGPTSPGPGSVCTDPRCAGSPPHAPFDPYSFGSPAPRRPGDYPRRIRVGTVTYRVSDTAEDWADASDTAAKVGESDHSNGIIRIKPGMAPSVVRITLWHEVLHAIMWSVLGGPKWDHIGDDDEQREEFIVGRLEHPTLAVLRDNPGLVRYLTGE